MNDILRIFFIVILLTITLAAYFLVIGVLFTYRVTKTQSIVILTRPPAARSGWGW